MSFSLLDCLRLRLHFLQKTPAPLSSVFSMLYLWYSSAFLKQNYKIHAKNLTATYLVMSVIQLICKNSKWDTVNGNKYIDDLIVTGDDIGEII